MGVCAIIQEEINHTNSIVFYTRYNIFLFVIIDSVNQTKLYYLIAFQENTKQITNNIPISSFFYFIFE